MSQNLLEIISKKGIISYEKLREVFLGSEEDLKAELDSLLEQERISKREVLLCSECGVTLGPVDDFNEDDETFCVDCENYIDVIEENFRTFFFSNCTINI